MLLGEWEIAFTLGVLCGALGITRMVSGRQYGGSDFVTYAHYLLRNVPGYLFVFLIVSFRFSPKYPYSGQRCCSILSCNRPVRLSSSVYQFLQGTADAIDIKTFVSSDGCIRVFY